jgi:tRNA pseudouridine38-40 synthase
MSVNTQSAAAVQNWKLTLAYDGTDYRGWQVQPNKRTIQGELQAALGRITRETPLPQGSGRTDAGVHALAQVASFALEARIPAQNLLMALNRTLPASIRILEARPVPATFHARHSAVAKSYEYRVFLERPGAGAKKSAPGRICSPFLAPYVYSCPWPLDLEALQAAARAFIGEHDFSSFAAVDPESSDSAAAPDATPHTRPLPRKDFSAEPPVAPSVRTIYSSLWEESCCGDAPHADLLVYRVHGSGFLHHMVRNLVGTMFDVGRGYMPPTEIPRILAARNRTAAGPTAPARGLFLHSVEYERPDQLETIPDPARFATLKQSGS